MSHLKTHLGERIDLGFWHPSMTFKVKYCVDGCGKAGAELAAMGWGWQWWHRRQDLKQRVFGVRVRPTDNRR